VDLSSNKLGGNREVHQNRSRVGYICRFDVGTCASGHIFKVVKHSKGHQAKDARRLPQQSRSDVRQALQLARASETARGRQHWRPLLIADLAMGSYRHDRASRDFLFPKHPT